MNKPWEHQENDHDFFTKEHISQFLRIHRTGVDNEGRYYLAQIINEYDNPTVLDVGCGSAVNFEVFKNFGLECKYVGLDRTQKLLDYANRLYGGEIKLFHGFSQELPFEDKSSNIVIIRHLVEHLCDGYENTLKEAFRVASDEVILVLFLDLLDQPDDLIQKRGPNENGHYHYWNHYSREKLFGFLRQYSGSVCEKKIYTLGAAFPDTVIRIKL